MGTRGAPLRTALVYDFDGTLAPGNIQEHSLLPRYLKIAPASFWKLVAAQKKANDADEILVYLRLILEKAAERGAPITRDVLRKHGVKTPLFAGVPKWFGRIDAHATARGLALEHYVISSGNEEMIAGTRIAAKFRKIFASRYHYDERGHAVWPDIAVNYTSKTQFLFRINKGVDNSWENEPVNRWQPMDERPVPFSRIIYLGDGDTDIPSMKMVRQQGGHALTTTAGPRRSTAFLVNASGPPPSRATV
jgi:hypothetical protein